VTMRLIEVKGRKSSEIPRDPKRTAPEWELEREYRSTYRAQLSETEKIMRANGSAILIIIREIRCRSRSSRILRETSA
jgi:hypothetical protein